MSMKDLIFEVLIPIIFSLICAILILIGIISFVTYFPNNYSEQYGNFICTTHKDWGYVKEIKTCYKIK